MGAKRNRASVKNKVLYIRLTALDDQLLKLLAKSRQLTVSETVRQLIVTGYETELRRKRPAAPPSGGLQEAN